MSRYLLYFFYYHTPDEELKIVLDFDSTQKAIEMLNEVQEEILYHIGEELEVTETNIQLIEPYGLRPFSTGIWNQPLDLFVSKYGNEFMIIDLTKPTMGLIEHLRPRVIGALRPRNIIEISVSSPLWNNRTKLELRLITALVQWLQYNQKRNWLQILPEDIEKHSHRVWQVKTVIPDSDSYTAIWKVILPNNYPESPPKLFINSSDRWLVRHIDKSQKWVDMKGNVFFLVNGINEESSGWSNTLFLCDWLIGGFWNFFARELKFTFKFLNTYQNNVGLKDYSKLIPGDLVDYNSDEIKERIIDTAIFLTWYSQRIPEKANETLQKLKTVVDKNVVFQKIKWRYILSILNHESLDLFFEDINVYYRSKIKDKDKIYSDDISMLEKSLEKSSSGSRMNYEELINDLKKNSFEKSKILTLEDLN